MFFSKFLLLSNTLEHYYIQLSLFISIFYLLRTKAYLNKLFSFLIIIVWIGMSLLFNNFEVMVTFLWILEFSFILVIGLLVISLSNYSANSYSDTFKGYNFLINLFIFFILIFAFIMIFLNKNFLGDLKLNLNYSLNYNPIIFNINFINYYQNINSNNYIMQTTSDIKDLGLKIYNYTPLLLILFLVFLIYVSIFIIITYLLSFNKLNINSVLKVNFEKKVNIRKSISNNSIKVQQLEKQMIVDPKLRKLKN